MRASREQAAKSHERIVDQSSRLFRERGFDGIGLAEIMRQAGLTHGGFYGHFDSKDDLIAAAVTRALAGSVAKWRRLADAAPDAPAAAIARHYLSPEHRDGPGSGCLVCALGPEIARQGDDARQAMAGGVRALIDLLADLIPAASEQERRNAALSLFSMLVGAVTLARAVDDPTFADEIAAAAETSVAALLVSTEQNALSKRENASMDRPARLSG